jgi:hypothetical protein
LVFKINISNRHFCKILDPIEIKRSCLLAINRRNIIRIARDIIARWRRIWIDIDNVPIVHLKARRVYHRNRLIDLCASVLKNHRNRIVNKPRPDNDLASACLAFDALAIHFLLAYPNDDMLRSSPKREKRTSFSFKVGCGCSNVLHALRAAKILRQRLATAWTDFVTSIVWRQYRVVLRNAV